MTSLVDHLIARVVPRAPRRLVSGVAARYIAGSDLAAAVAVARRLADQGVLSTVDVLGEAVLDLAEADAFTAEYVALVGSLAAEGLEAHVSVKPTALGSDLSWERATANVRTILAAARAVGGTVNVDMEGAATTDGTLALFREVQGEGSVAVVLQARLHRTVADVASLAPLAPHVRLCKGIYPEPSSIAFTDDRAICASYLDCLDRLLAAGSHVAIATHHDVLVDGARELLARHGRTADSYEFQTLLGVREDLVDALVADGHRVRVYVPFGPQWYDYSMRRLRESPHVARHVAGAVVSRAVSRLSPRRSR
jgi:proline dehydrogenase